MISYLSFEFSNGNFLLCVQGPNANVTSVRFVFLRLL